MAKRAGLRIALVVLACLLPVVVRSAEHPLNQDDVTLLLIGGATTEKMIELIGKRGVDFRMNPDLAKKFHDSGADDRVIEALQAAGEKLKASPASTTAAPGVRGETAAAPSASPSAVQPKEGGDHPAAPSTVSPVSEAKPITPSAPSGSSVTPAAPRPVSTGGIDLSDPSPNRILNIIQQFAAREKLFKEARDNYTYHQINKVETLDPDGNVDGTYEQEWDILYDDSGKRIEHVTYAPVSTLQRIIVTAEDLDAMRNIQPFVLTTDELPEYEIKYLGHVKLDLITAYVFSIRPKEMKKGRQYFQGTVWVDDRDLQIVKSEGKNVPELKTKKGENLFPRFATYREQIDGKFWFPTFTMADDTLYFSNGGPVHIKEIVKYTDYKQFKSKVRILSATPTDQPNAPSIPLPKQ